MAVMLPDKWSQLKLPSIGKADPAEQERLLKLFWNRAELKKELQSLDDQLHNLRNKLKQQENANTRLQQQLEQLEVLLGSPERGLDALVHFGLKALWRACREQLEKFAAELKRERQDAQRKLQLAEFQQDRAERLKVADERLRQAQEVTDAERARMADCERRLGQLQRFWHYFKRRTLAAEILAKRERCVAAEHHLGEMREAHRTIEKEPWPEFPGLTIDGRRLVNLAVIAYLPAPVRAPRGVRPRDGRPPGEQPQRRERQARQPRSLPVTAAGGRPGACARERAGRAGGRDQEARRETGGDGDLAQCQRDRAAAGLAASGGDRRGARCQRPRGRLLGRVQGPAALKSGRCPLNLTLAQLPHANAA